MFHDKGKLNRVRKERALLVPMLMWQTLLACPGEGWSWSPDCEEMENQWKVEKWRQPSELIFQEIHLYIDTE